MSTVAEDVTVPIAEHERLIVVARELVDQNTQLVSINDSLIRFIRQLIEAITPNRPPRLVVIPDPRPGDEGC